MKGFITLRCPLCGRIEYVIAGACWCPCDGVNYTEMVPFHPQAVKV